MVSSNLIISAREVYLPQGSSQVQFTGNDVTNANYQSLLSMGNSSPYLNSMVRIPERGFGFRETVLYLVGLFMICNNNKQARMDTSCPVASSMSFDKPAASAKNFMTFLNSTID